MHAGAPRKGSDGAKDLQFPLAELDLATPDRYITRMSTYTIADAQQRLPELIAQAEKGEDVVITREGVAVAQVRAVVRARRVVTEDDLKWLQTNVIQPLRPLPEDAGTLVSRMRDEDWR